MSRTSQPGMLTYAELDGNIMSEFKVIVNASPVGMYPKTEEAPDIPYELLSSKHLLYDLVYNPSETKFMRLGKENGAVVKNGEEMLVLQAVAAWKIWNR